MIAHRIEWFVVYEMAIARAVAPADHRGKGHGQRPGEHERGARKMHAVESRPSSTKGAPRPIHAGLSIETWFGISRTRASQLSIPG
jgi:hypothetical protein